MSLTCFPQLATGAVSQFPVQKRISYRTITNQLEDGSRIVLADPNAGTIQWQMSYSGISDTEGDAFVAFFSSVEGRLRPFTFLDPVGNLLAWSEALDSSAWQKNGLIALHKNISDPLGTQRASTIVNNGAAGLSVGQSLAVPGSTTCCLSFYARSNSAQAIGLVRTSGGLTSSDNAVAGSEWQRFALTSSLPGGSDTSFFEVTFAAGASLDLFGMQVDPQPAASQYVPSFAIGGVYPQTRFDMDELSMTATSPNQNSCVLKLVTHVNG